MSLKLIRVAVVDDHSLFRRGLISLLGDMPEFEVVGESSNGEEALNILPGINPDVVLMDVNMPGMDGIMTVQNLRSINFQGRILMLTISKENDDLLGAIQSGADGYLLKNTEPEELKRAIIRASQGQGVLSPEVTAAVMKVVARHGVEDGASLLSEREIEVLNCLADGLTTQQIAARLYISENTVKTHIRHILEKLEASNRTEAVSKAIQLGLIQRRP
jgi:DNA-binding NarL/FixJ family response regulator